MPGGRLKNFSNKAVCNNCDKGCSAVMRSFEYRERGEFLSIQLREKYFRFCLFLNKRLFHGKKKGILMCGPRLSPALFGHILHTQS